MRYSATGQGSMSSGATVILWWKWSCRELMKLRVYLVDDEPLALERLRRLLQNTGRVEVVGSTTKPEEAVAALTRGSARCVFSRYPDASAEWL
jgi:PleD family two-component response regulator